MKIKKYIPCHKKPSLEERVEALEYWVEDYKTSKIQELQSELKRTALETCHFPFYMGKL